MNNIQTGRITKWQKITVLNWIRDGMPYNNINDIPQLVRHVSTNYLGSMIRSLLDVGARDTALELVKFKTGKAGLNEITGKNPRSILENMAMINSTTVMVELLDM